MRNWPKSGRDNILRNVLSCFDGISCGRVALDRAGISYENYYASEIDKAVMKVANINYQTTIQLGSITDWKSCDLENIDLIMGGSPCQGFSSSGKGLNFSDPRSKLFFDFMEVIKHYKPKYFLLENVKMKQEWIDIITDIIGVKPVLINANLVSAQNRPRLYWCNWEVTQPTDKGIKLSTILEKDLDWNPAHIVGRRIDPMTNTRKDYDKSIPYTQTLQVKKCSDKMGCLTTVSKDSLLSCLPHGRYIDAYNSLTKNKDWRELSVIECERLQTLSDNYTSAASDSARKKMCGNGWNVNTIVHIFNSME
jgi:DNA (cytosine-5)-methyltransferase 1